VRGKNVLAMRARVPILYVHLHEYRDACVHPCVYAHAQTSRVTAYVCVIGNACILRMQEGMQAVHVGGAGMYVAA
jgi:hypothetical protein